ncbi:hypothetical protein BFQ30_08895 [Haemophilus quentini]|uniref:DUF2681 domain-containing protein n=1 Tax=Haemophilus quentini TaxID=123834 RepID=A0ABX3BNM6_9PAST|nr:MULTISPECIES: DUF2681 domain-containing protein [Pasteurellaceae]EGT80295.1 Hypothetical protein GGE_1635 [Haemophilus haemolyticus M21639]DAX72709.1 MAG TPA: Protein of unknown function (DUF2681) [Caudoviricetes sp.]EGT81814.1 Hypothetical protein GGE_1052 [Haemophilus haemolyticus M21639]NYA48237.1 DUF2681 domain-containing protein [Haemophilus haemolyticus]OEY75687.1 hypothetical protein BFQ29_09200 [Haemophilus quentini]
MSMQIILAGLGIFALLGAYVMFKLKHAHREIEQLLKTNAQLQAQKAVVETQVKHFEVRKKNEENTRITSRDDVINRLQQSGDLRD